jgi:hypothetical protein
MRDMFIAISTSFHNLCICILFTREPSINIETLASFEPIRNNIPVCRDKLLNCLTKHYISLRDIGREDIQALPRQSEMAFLRRAWRARLTCQAIRGVVSV